MLQLRDLFWVFILYQRLAAGHQPTAKVINNQACYSCTTMLVDDMLQEIQDADWQRWLMTIRGTPHTDQCGEIQFQANFAERVGISLPDCNGGVCMKMWFQERGGKREVWRSCIPGAQGQVQVDCTRVSSAQGDMEVCVCEGDRCNSASQQQLCNYLWYVTSLLLLVLLMCNVQRIH